jgi:DNA-3-methyladenine glycosylase
MRASTGDHARRRLRRSFFARPTLEVARDLLGRTLCRRLADGRTLRGRITEVEAYDGPADRASHAHRGPTPRNRPMFEPGGIAYVYLVYGMHHCLNLVTGERGYPAAVLVRATEPPEPGRRTTGPGLVARAFEIDRGLDGASVVSRELWLEHGEPVDDRHVRRTPRVGVDYAGAWARRPYRFVISA